jgi:hypothetical protein
LVRMKLLFHLNKPYGSILRNTYGITLTFNVE